MKTKQTIVTALSLLAVGTAVAQDTIIDATSYNTTTGEVSYITGTTTESTFGSMSDALREANRRNEASRAWSNAREQRWEMEAQTAELKKQTELLQKIANQ